MGKSEEEVFNSIKLYKPVVLYPEVLLANRQKERHASLAHPTPFLPPRVVYVHASEGRR